MKRLHCRLPFVGIKAVRESKVRSDELCEARSPYLTHTHVAAHAREHAHIHCYSLNGYLNEYNSALHQVPVCVTDGSSANTTHHIRLWREVCEICSAMGNENYW